MEQVGGGGGEGDLLRWGGILSKWDKLVGGGVIC